MLFLLAAGTGINLFTIYQLLSGKDARALPNKMAIAIISLWSLRFLLLYLKINKFAHTIPPLLLIDQYLFLLDSVLLWLYAKSLLSPFQFSLKTMLHFIPFLFGMCIAATTIALNTPEEILQKYLETIEALENFKMTTPVGAIVFTGLLLLTSVVYFLKSLTAIKQYNHSLFANFSNLKHLKAGWLITFHRLWVGLFLIPVLLYFTNYLILWVNTNTLGISLLSSFVLLAFFFNANVINQSYAVATLTIEKGTDKAENVSGVRPTSPEQLQHLTQSLSEQKYYEDESLSLSKLAAYLEIKPTALTDLIKQTEYDNFYDLINSYRIEAVKNDLARSQEQVMIIAYNNGFNSKSAFNKIFKEKVGMTPSAYRKLQKTSVSA